MAKKKNMNKDGRYEVGYKKPPRHSQFQPGKSGNPNGRPKKRENVADVLQKELNSRVPVLKDGKRRKISMLRAIFKQQLNKAASGDARAAAVFISALKLFKPDSGDNLGTLLQEFRALHLRRIESEQDVTGSADEIEKKRAGDAQT